MRKYFWVLFLYIFVNILFGFMKTSEREKKQSYSPLNFLPYSLGKLQHDSLIHLFSLWFVKVVKITRSTDALFSRFSLSSFLFCFDLVWIFCFVLFLIIFSSSQSKKTHADKHHNKWKYIKQLWHYCVKDSFSSQLKLTNIAKLKRMSFMWKYMTEYDLVFIIVSDRNFNLQVKLLWRNY